MSNLDRWFPFKFKRKKAEEKASSEPSERSERAAALAPFFGAPMPSLMRAMLQDPFFQRPLGGDLDRWFGDFSPARFSPSVDVVDEESHLRVTAELPGMTKEDVQIHVDDRGLTIRGEKRHEEEKEEEGCYRTERSYGMFTRSVPLPADVDAENAEASFDKGVLSVRLPKKPQPEAGRKKIEIG